MSDDTPSDTDQSDDPDGRCDDCTDRELTRRRLAGIASVSAAGIGLSGCLGLEDEFATTEDAREFSATPEPIAAPDDGKPTTATDGSSAPDGTEATDGPGASTDGPPTTDSASASTPTSGTDEPATTTAPPTDRIAAIPLEDGDGNTVEGSRLDYGEWIRVTPAREDSSLPPEILLLRYPPEEYESPTKTDWTIGGYVAYSARCTHQGCSVGGRDADLLVCPCHGGQFAPLEGATVVGGPPPRALPQLRLSATEDGTILAAPGEARLASSTLLDGSTLPGGESHE